MLLLLFAQGLAGDTHDGFDADEVRRRVDERAAEYRRSRERLRADIVLAMDGPQEPQVVALVDAYIGDERAELEKPGYEPELRGLVAEMSGLRRMAELAIAEEKRRFDEDERDVELLLLA